MKTSASAGAYMCMAACIYWIGGPQQAGQSNRRRPRRRRDLRRCGSGRATATGPVAPPKKNNRSCRRFPQAFAQNKVDGERARAEATLKHARKPYIVDGWIAPVMDPLWPVIPNIPREPDCTAGGPDRPTPAADRNAVADWANRTHDRGRWCVGSMRVSSSGAAWLVPEPCRRFYDYSFQSSRLNRTTIWT